MSLLEHLKNKLRANRIVYKPLRRLSVIVAPHLNLAVKSNFKNLKRLLLETTDNPKLLFVGGGMYHLGEGSSKLGEDILKNAVNLEVAQGPLVDVIGDGHDLPFKNNTFDAVICKAVLEHVKHPIEVTKEIYRVLRHGGYVYIEVPFLQPFHSYPYDFQRYTVSGVDVLFARYKKIQSGLTNGPGSTLNWVLVEFLALLFSFNINKLYVFLTYLFRFFLFPIKYFDVLLNRYGNALNSCSGIYFLGQK